MSDQAPQTPPGDGAGTPPGTPQTANGPRDERPPLAIATQYLKDLSFEAPNAPGVFLLLQKTPAHIEYDLDVGVEALGPDQYEVVLAVKVICKAGETSAFLIELAYGGVFEVRVAAEHREPVLRIECARMLFPFVRSIVADCTRHGGFPPVLLPIADFVGLYQNGLRRRAAAQPAPQATA